MGNSWTKFDRAQLEATQDEVLRRVERHCEDAGSAVVFKRVHTAIDADPVAANGLDSEARRTIHSIECEPAELQPKQPPIVILHGYAAGALMFVDNLAELAQRTKRRCIAVDWNGSGASSRSDYTAKNHDQSADFFLSAFEEWREKREIETCDLVGHSLGGYLSVLYLRKLQQQQEAGPADGLSPQLQSLPTVRNLVLASPVGFPERPPPRKDTPAFWKVVSMMWGWGVTPNHVIRAAGPWGKGLVEKAVDSRFHKDRTLGVRGLDPAVDGDLYVTYLHQITANRGSGEHALSDLLHPGAFAKKPLKHELPKLAKQRTMVVFGTSDWMSRDIMHAREATERMENATVVQVPGTHHVYLSSEFNDQVVNFLQSDQALQ